MTAEGKTFQIEFQPAGKKIQIEQGSTLLDAARDGGLHLLSVCGGIGICHDCIIRLISGKSSPLSREEMRTFSKEEIQQGYRLACQAIPEEDCIVEVPFGSLSTLQRIQVEGDHGIDQSNPGFHLRKISLDDTIDYDQHQIRKSINKLVSQGEKHAWLMYRDNEPVIVFPAESEILGLAVDMGSTKLAGYLVDLKSGRTISRTGLMNPQVVYGDDVVNRISYANISLSNQKQLQTTLLNAIQEMADTLCKEAGFETCQIVDVVLVGNTVMQHLAAGRPVSSLGEAPYTPDTLLAEEISSAQLGFPFNPIARVYMPPIISGYIGGDHVAMCLSTGAFLPNQDILALDIGTNTEITLCANGKSFSCSCASGPAFEGARIQMGMRAASGAIEKVQFSDGRILYSTIDNLPAIGICGSGILDAIHVMRMDGALDMQGRLIKNHPRVMEHGNITGYQLVTAAESGTGKPILITRKDVHEIQLAKAAIRTGIDILLRESGYDPARLQQFIIAGAFGTYLDLESAVKIGMFPLLDRNVFLQVGNAAGAGARRLLTTESARGMAKQIARETQPVELTTYPDFMDQYLQNLQF